MRELVRVDLEGRMACVVPVGAGGGRNGTRGDAGSRGVRKITITVRRSVAVRTTLRGKRCQQISKHMHGG